MGLLDFFTSKKALTTIQSVKQWQMFNGGQTYSLYNTDYRDAINNGFEKNVDVYAIVDDISARSVEVPLELYQANKMQIKSVSKYKALLTRPTDRSMMEANSIRSKAMKELEEHPILALLKRPNSYQTSKQFFQSLFSWDLLVKDVGIWAEEDPLKKGKIARLHVIAPFDYTIVTDGFRRIVKYKIHSINQDIEPAFFLSFRSFNPDFNNQTTVHRGFSPLTAGARVLQKANSGEEVAIENFETRGAVGFLYKDDMNTEDIDPTVQQDLEDKVYDKIYNSNAKGRVVFSNTKVGFTKLSTTNID